MRIGSDELLMTRRLVAMMTTLRASSLGSFGTLFLQQQLYVLDMARHILWIILFNSNSYKDSYSKNSQIQTFKNATLLNF